MRWGWISIVALFGFGITACGTGGSSSEGDASADAGSSTAAGSGSGSGAATEEGSATEAGGTSMGATSMGATGMGSTDDGPGCPAFADEASPGVISIEVTNLRAEAVWVPMGAGCIEPVPYVLTGPDGAEVAWRAPACGTCEGAVQGQCPCPPPFCDEATALYLEPGATVRYEWSGLVHVDEVVPQECPGIADCGATCQRAVVAPAGEHVFAIMAGGASGCAVEPCACMPMDGACTLYDAGMVFTELVDVEAMIVLPGAGVVALDIE